MPQASYLRSPALFVCCFLGDEIDSGISVAQQGPSSTRLCLTCCTPTLLPCSLCDGSWWSYCYLDVAQSLPAALTSLRDQTQFTERTSTCSGNLSCRNGNTCVLQHPCQVLCWMAAPGEWLAPEVQWDHGASAGDPLTPAQGHAWGHDSLNQKTLLFQQGSFLSWDFWPMARFQQWNFKHVDLHDEFDEMKLKHKTSMSQDLISLGLIDEFFQICRWEATSWSSAGIGSWNFPDCRKSRTIFVVWIISFGLVMSGFPESLSNTGLLFCKAFPYLHGVQFCTCPGADWSPHAFLTESLVSIACKWLRALSWKIIWIIHMLTYLSTCIFTERRKSVFALRYLLLLSVVRSCWGLCRSVFVAKTWGAAPNWPWLDKKSLSWLIHSTRCIQFLQRFSSKSGLH